MSDISLSPTPSQENLANVMDATMYNAIDTFMANEEQPYDSFMKQFTHFTQDDVKADMLRKREAMLKKMKQSNRTHEGNKQSSVPDQDNDNTCPGVLPGEEEELEEEVLDLGTRSSIMTSGINKGPKKSTVQFDNFVELDVSDSEDILEDSDYVASFAGQKSSVKSEEPSLSHQGLEDIQEADSQGEITRASIAARELSEAISTVDSRSDVINPGEVEDLPSVKPVTQKDQTLDFSAKFLEGGPIKDDHQECSDEVEPFSLDRDFDYDNVILTPKYSQEDVNLMKTLRDQNKTQQTDTQENET
ncbi:uncharacterized protein C11orf74 homolog [Mizuhopecten yessoensis]|uniref:uncharacterized protein C11orf74 homolog n=1 Tax=Mizuhopecten yessoensis TaxID=6573 RepID=UPI000B45E4B4|nr:uncharacterized protein C11orf74 homolog [Mizuhopecten yessoensis]